MARAQIFEGFQLALESTPGTAVAANKKIRSVDLDADPITPTEVIRPIGYKTATGLILGKEMSEATFKGALSYTDAVYFLSSILERETITTPTNGVLTRRWTYQPAVAAPDSFATYTIERGSSSGACSFPHAVVDDLEISFTKRTCEVKGKFIGAKMTDGISMTASPTEIVLKPVAATQVGVYVGTTVGGLALITNCLEASFAIKNRYSPVFYLNPNQASYGDVAERHLVMSAMISLELNTAAQAYMTNLRNQDVLFARFKATGALIESVTPDYKYDLEITFPFQFAANKRGNKDDLHAGDFELLPVYDSGVGYAVKVVVDNTLTSL